MHKCVSAALLSTFVAAYSFSAIAQTTAPTSPASPSSWLSALTDRRAQSATDACRFETAKRWRANVVTGACVESWSPYYSSLTQGAEPEMASCAERNEAKAFMTMCMTSKGYALAERCKDLRIERFSADCYN